MTPQLMARPEVLMPAELAVYPDGTRLRSGAAVTQRRLFHDLRQPLGRRPRDAIRRRVRWTFSEKST